MSRLPEYDRDLSSRLKRIENDVKRLQGATPFAFTGIAPQGGGVSQVVPGADLDVMGNLNVTGTLNVGGESLFGGSVTIVSGADLILDGGAFTSKSADGTVDLMEIGPQVHGDRGFTLRRDDGSAAVEVRKVFGPGDSKQVARLLDREGRVIIGDAVLSTAGFDAPYIPIPFAPTDVDSGARKQSTTSTSFVPLFEHFGYRQNPALWLSVSAWCSDGSTAGEIQVYDPAGAVYLGGYLGSPAVRTTAIPAGTVAPTTFAIDSAVMPGSAPSMGDALQLEIHARRTAGSGTVNVVVRRSYGRGV